MASEISAPRFRGGADFSIAAVFARCLRTCRRRFPAFLLATLLVTVPFETALLQLIRNNVGGLDHHDTGGPVFIALFVLLLYAAQSALCAGAFRDMAGDTVALGRSVRDGLVRLPFVIVAVAVAWLAILLGSVALAVPGIFFFAATAVALQASVIERLGPFAALLRSAALTKGHAGRILAIYLIEIVGCYGLGFGIVWLMVRLVPPHPWNVIWLLSLEAALEGFAAVLNTAVYFELRRVREGDTGGLAAVFD
jgi:hypothetical protein